MKLELNDEERALIERSDAMKAEAEALRKTALGKRDARELELPAVERLTFAATWRCACGHGMAYDPQGKLRSDTDSPHVMPSQWECSAILLGIGDKALLHTPPAPFAFWEAKSENQNSANGMTTRTPAEPSADAYPAIEVVA